MQSFSDTLDQVLRAIMANKVRSFLTMFGIAWGVGSLLVLVGLGEGFRSGQHRQLATFGDDLVQIRDLAQAGQHGCCDLRRTVDKADGFQAGPTVVGDGVGRKA